MHITLNLKLLLISLLPPTLYHPRYPIALQKDNWITYDKVYRLGCIYYTVHYV